MKHLEQGSPEWVEMRKNYIGASDAPIIMGVSPWMTPLQLWEQKLGFFEVKENFAMKRGKYLEQEARKEFEEETGLIVFPDVVLHTTYAWMMASLDGIDIERKNIVEIKCPGKKDHILALLGEIPEKYYPQLQHQMEVCNLKSIFYFSYSPSAKDMKKTALLEVAKDEKYIDLLIKKESEFYDCMVSLTMPSCIV